MTKKEDNSRVIEYGDIFFFYRPKIESTEVKELEDVLNLSQVYI